MGCRRSWGRLGCQAFTYGAKIWHGPAFMTLTLTWWWYGTDGNVVGMLFSHLRTLYSQSRICSPMGTSGSKVEMLQHCIPTWEHHIPKKGILCFQKGTLPDWNIMFAHGNIVFPHENAQGTHWGHKGNPFRICLVPHTWEHAIPIWEQSNECSSTAASNTNSTCKLPSWLWFH